MIGTPLPGLGSREVVWLGRTMVSDTIATQELCNGFRHFGRRLFMRPMAGVVQRQNLRPRQYSSPPLEQVRAKSGVLEPPDDRRRDRLHVFDARIQFLVVGRRSKQRLSQRPEDQ